jgi:positive regulator of sigma E activity
MKTIERIILFLALAVLCPLIGFLAGWWFFYLLLPDARILIPVFFGMGLGFLANFFFLKRWMNQAHQMSLWIWAAFYGFYMIGVFGFFMGVPIFNIFLGIPAGILMAGRLVEYKAEPAQMEKIALRTAWFTTGVLSLVCLASAVLALRDPYTAGNLEGMLALPFEVTQPMIWALILTGGLGLLAGQWLLTFLTTKISFSALSRGMRLSD